MVKTEIKKCTECGAEITGWGKDHLNRNYEAHMEQQHNKEIKKPKNKKKEEPEEIVEEVVLEDMTKDQINDLAAEQGFKDEIKSYWTKKKMIKKLSKLMD